MKSTAGRWSCTAIASLPSVLAARTGGMSKANKSRTVPQLPATWNHPKLGLFKYRGGWAKELNFPAFKAFSYDTGYANARRSTGKQGMLFWAKSERDLP